MTVFYVKPTLNCTKMMVASFSEILKGVITQNFLGPRPKPPHFSSAGSVADLEVPFPLFLPPPLHEASSASGLATLLWTMKAKIVDLLTIWIPWMSIKPLNKRPLQHSNHFNKQPPTI